MSELYENNEFNGEMNETETSTGNGGSGLGILLGIGIGAVGTAVVGFVGSKVKKHFQKKKEDDDEKAEKPGKIKKLSEAADKVKENLKK